MACSPSLPLSHPVAPDERRATALARLLADIAETGEDASEQEVTDLPADLLLALAAWTARRTA